ncbi:hypothetical protein AC579_6713 [Pseudocercospora musae]|uniref:Luciferase-like domain-containing protein n=1 Tax=Pseudocercospora musae TaxID=113226 RepID=A0A139IHS6_9PEZI|nr:hypothetical protein AC579_6713 [Pseudocercospora musae]
MGEAGPPVKKWILNAFSMATPGHVSAGMWRHPENRIRDFNTLEYWTDLAQILDGNFHGLFLADMLGIYDVYKGPDNIDEALPGGAQFPNADPSIYISAMAAVTKSLGFAFTASTTYEHPFLLARRFATLDHATNGRIAWNIVTSFLLSAARNLGLPDQIPHDERYEIAREYVEVVYKLWESSWRDDACPKDTQYSVPGRVRRINHVGRYFQVAGPHLVEPSRQRTPFIFQAGASRAGRPFAAASAEAMFIPGMDIETVRKSVVEIRKVATEAGRDANAMKLIVGMLIIVDETNELARAKYEHLLSYADLEGSLTLFAGWTGVDLGPFGDDDDLVFPGAPGGITSVVNAWNATIPGSDGIKWTKKRVARELALGGPHPKIIGSTKTVVDELDRWVDVTGVDGFNCSAAITPGTFEDIVRWVVPELKARGVFWDSERAIGRTMRENYLDDGRGPHLRDDHPGSLYKWRAPVKTSKSFAKLWPE